MSNNEEVAPLDFIRQIVANDVSEGKHQGRVVTRFPPEPNGFLHIGHAKSICLNFGVASEYPGGQCNLRFDDTNPLKEEDLYIQSIRTDVKWLGFDWQEHMYYASDYFEPLYKFAERLIEDGHAFVCELNVEQMREYRGTLTEAGKESPWRNRPMAESLDLLRRMRAGEFPEGRYTLRAKIDMASPNINMRDPVIYRILHAHHHQTAGQWCIYPTYDYAHCISDALEGITHSLCTLEFEDHRPLYDWILDRLSGVLSCHPQQIEFSRLVLEYTVVSKRKLNALVRSGAVDGWDDPRMPTISGLRRRGYTPSAIREFCRRIGISKTPNNVELSLLESCIRDDLEQHAPRAMAVLNPLKVVITTVAEEHCAELSAANHPQNPALGSRKLYWMREIIIEREDFAENPPKQFKRLVPGGEVRLRHAYVIRCDEVIKDPASGEVVELRCSHDPATLHANPSDRKVKGVIHWLPLARSCPAEIRSYETLFNTANPDEEWQGDDFTRLLNPNSLQILSASRIEEGLQNLPPGTIYQFERQGYFCVDSKYSSPGKPVFNRTVGLRDSWGKQQNKES
ncbi:glutamine--tRNA ligase/YqeY domain fusion protein [Candidatus Magnetaquicoccus inordinatus]|uniref:glutamine--tRNA ligase/YqeY domain fusion protein n=1 Tax=Candidatus Magnetaquicoccus inordinatus TaxID=2496818 RepID=UPI00102CB6C9|nr:glutamine--tRNA ligase/YqeY domain fusion protein [Candidatus Magnetaquicoccus inordinatus]